METKNRLILISNAFPYGNWEAYLETEVKYYDCFDEVLVLALQIRKSHQKTVRSLPEKFSVCPVTYASKLTYLLNSICALFDKNFYAEFVKLVKQRRLSCRALVKLFVFFSRAHYETRIIKRYLRKHGLVNDGSRGVIYSYRFEYQPYIGILLKKFFPQYKSVARAHGYDLYEERNTAKYIPMREFILQRLDRLYLISEDGYSYIAEKFPPFKEKLCVSRLGTLDYGVTEVKQNDSFHIVSCSNVVPVKRLNLLVEALKNINLNIIWTHYGAGMLLDDLILQCKDMPENIQCVFRGQIDNSALMSEYKEKPYHLFVNVSESEGIPVSIMEAMSFGMPCIATDVGGSREIVFNRKNGILLPKDFSVEQLASFITMFASMDEALYQQYRVSARQTWEAYYSAEKNYPQFVHELCKL